MIQQVKWVFYSFLELCITYVLGIISNVTFSAVG